MMKVDSDKHNDAHFCNDCQLYELESLTLSHQLKPGNGLLKLVREDPISYVDQDLWGRQSCTCNFGAPEVLINMLDRIFLYKMQEAIPRLQLMTYNEFESAQETG